MRLLAFALALALPLSTGTAQTSTDGEPPLVLAYGDSLTAGYELPSGLGFAPQLQDKLRREGIPATVVDGGVSGDTTSAGLARLDFTLDGMDRAPDLVILELGGNDMLRALDPAVTRDNLAAMIEAFEARGSTVLLAGMRAAPNYDPAFIEQFEAIFPDLAAEYDLALYPFFLEGVAQNPELMMDDRIHPEFGGIKVMVEGIAPMVTQAL